jgi:hypothetical protein
VTTKITIENLGPKAVWADQKGAGRTRLAEGETVTLTIWAKSSVLIEEEILFEDQGEAE